MLTLGVCLSTIRPELWEGLFSNLATNSIDFEIVFVGPIKDFSLPQNSRFIYSDACPAKCFHIGMMASNSEYVLSISDDARFDSESALDRLVEDIKGCPPISIVSPLYVRKDRRVPKQTFAPFNKIKTYNPLMSVGTLISKQLYIDLGGIDRRFRNSFWDLDIAMRVYEKGGKVHINDSVTVFEIVPGKLARTPISRKDDKILRSFWCTGRRKSGWTVHKKRRCPVLSFGDVDVI